MSANNPSIDKKVIYPTTLEALSRLETKSLPSASAVNNKATSDLDRFQSARKSAVESAISMLKCIMSINHYLGKVEDAPDEEATATNINNEKKVNFAHNLSLLTNKEARLACQAIIKKHATTEDAAAISKILSAPIKISNNARDVLCHANRNLKKLVDSEMACLSDLKKIDLRLSISAVKAILSLALEAADMEESPLKIGDSSIETKELDSAYSILKKEVAQATAAFTLPQSTPITRHLCFVNLIRELSSYMTCLSKQPMWGAQTDSFSLLCETFYNKTSLFQSGLVMFIDICENEDYNKIAYSDYVRNAHKKRVAQVSLAAQKIRKAILSADNQTELTVFDSPSLDCIVKPEILFSEPAKSLLAYNFSLEELEKLSLQRKTRQQTPYSESAEYEHLQIHRQNAQDLLAKLKTFDKDTIKESIFSLHQESVINDIQKARLLDCFDIVEIKANEIKVEKPSQKELEDRKLLQETLKDLGISSHAIMEAASLGKLSLKQFDQRSTSLTAALGNNSLMANRLLVSRPEMLTEESCVFAAYVKKVGSTISEINARGLANTSLFNSNTHLAEYGHIDGMTRLERKLSLYDNTLDVDAVDSILQQNPALLSCEESTFKAYNTQLQSVLASIQRHSLRELPEYTPGRCPENFCNMQQLEATAERVMIESELAKEKLDSAFCWAILRAIHKQGEQSNKRLNVIKEYGTWKPQELQWTLQMLGYFNAFSFVGKGIVLNSKTGSDGPRLEALKKMVKAIKAEAKTEESSYVPFITLEVGSPSSSSSLHTKGSIRPMPRDLQTNNNWHMKN